MKQSQLIRCLAAGALLAASGAALSAPVTLLSDNSINDGTLYTSSFSGADGSTASTATWNWNGSVLTQTGGTFYTTEHLGNNPLFPVLIQDQIVGLVINTGASTVTATTYQCNEGTFGPSIGVSLCGQITYGANDIPEFSFLNNFGGNADCIQKIVGGDDVDLGPARGLSTHGAAGSCSAQYGAYERYTVSYAAGILTLSNGIPVNTEGSIWMTFALGAPEISIADAGTLEGDSGSHNLSFTATLSAPAAGTVTVDYATADQTATAGSDYVATSGTLTFAPGVTSQQINVSISGDTAVESDETFNVVLSNPSANATIADASAIGTIFNDDAGQPVQISIANATTLEGDSGSHGLSFTVTLSAVSAAVVAVDYTTVDGTASSGAGADYTATSGTLFIPSGATTQYIRVPILGDTVAESDETFSVVLSNPSANATIATGTATGHILNDDGTPPDADGDGIPDAVDNCTLVANGTHTPGIDLYQRDFDGDGYGSICDADLNNSGLTTTSDYTILRNVLNTSNGNADLNGSGLVTTSDYTILRNRLNTAPGPSGLHP